jgi:GxxExxY protein
MLTGSVLSRKSLDKISYDVLGAAMEVHRTLGPGLLESVYQKCLFHELRLREIYFVSGLNTPLDYKGLLTEADLRCDFFIENSLVVEIKSVEALAPIHEAQLLTYMALLKAPKGLLINFNTISLYKEGQKTLVNKYYWELPLIST